MKSIGGYFELELPVREEYHKGALKLNTGRNALEYVLLKKGYKKIYIPYFTCDVLLEPLAKLKVTYEFYNIDDNLNPIFDFGKVEQSECFLLTNYFGLCDKKVEEISKLATNLIIDNSQAFFSRPLENIDTFYSPRKYFGVPDGAYLYLEKESGVELDQDISYTRMNHLIGRIETGAETFYDEFKKNDNSLIGQPIKIMSNITAKILSSIDYAGIANRRRGNFNVLHYEFSKLNKLKFFLQEGFVPMMYPLFIDNGDEVKLKLIENKIFTPTYWPNVFEWSEKGSFEYSLAEKCVFLPIDQRYSKKEMMQIIDVIKSYV